MKNLMSRNKSYAKLILTVIILAFPELLIARNYKGYWGEISVIIDRPSLSVREHSRAHALNLMEEKVQELLPYYLEIRRFAVIRAPWTDDVPALSKYSIRVSLSPEFFSEDGALSVPYEIWFYRNGKLVTKMDALCRTTGGGFYTCGTRIASTAMRVVWRNR